jgi:D-aminoacyl-tRNA deacylase
MIAFLQRVSKAQVHVDSRQVANIRAGLMVLLCAEREDAQSDADQLLEKLLNYRVFGDKDGKMNVSLLQLAEIADSAKKSSEHALGGEDLLEVGLLIVPQFTLAADTRSGARPSFTPAAGPELGRHLFDYFVAQSRAKNIRSLAVETGVFGAHMQVSLVNDGPVSFWLQTRKNTISPSQASVKLKP